MATQTMESNMKLIDKKSEYQDWVNDLSKQNLTPQDEFMYRAALNDTGKFNPLTLLSSLPMFKKIAWYKGANKAKTRLKTPKVKF